MFEQKSIRFIVDIVKEKFSVDRGQKDIDVISGK